MYQKILNEAIRELKRTDFKDVFAEELERKKDFVADCNIDTDLEILIPETYIDSITERLSLYTQLDDLEEEEELQMFEEELKDRFGPIPPQVHELLTTIRCRWMAKELGFEKLILKSEQLRLYFINDPDSPYFESDTFNQIMNFIQRDINNASLKQVGKNFLLKVANIKSMSNVHQLLERMMKSVSTPA